LGIIGIDNYFPQVSGRFAIRNSEFTATLPENLFNGLTAIEGIEFSGNEWPCGDNQCDGIEQFGESINE
jgi:hypothetical protein